MVVTHSALLSCLPRPALLAQPTPTRQDSEARFAPGGGEGKRGGRKRGARGKLRLDLWRPRGGSSTIVAELTLNGCKSSLSGVCFVELLAGEETCFPVINLAGGMSQHPMTRLSSEMPVGGGLSIQLSGTLQTFSFLRPLTLEGEEDAKSAENDGLCSNMKCGAAPRFPQTGKGK